MTQRAEVAIRVQEPGQLRKRLDVLTAALPADTHLSLEQAKIEESLHRPEEPPLRLLAWSSGEAVAAGYSGRNVFSAEGRYRIGIAVRPEYRRQGIARSLYAQLVPYAREHGARALTAQVHEHCLPLVESWLAEEGYEESERGRPSELSLDEFDDKQWSATEERVIESGIQLTTLAAEDTEANRRKLLDLSNLTGRDIPHEVHEDQSFELFNDLLGRPEALPDCLVIAKDGDAYVGLSLLVHQTPDQALTGMTGVAPAYRNRGIALALKVHSARLARARGYKSMRTFNHVNNPAMLAVNTRLGYRPLPESISFRKYL